MEKKSSFWNEKKGNLLTDKTIAIILAVALFLVVGMLIYLFWGTLSEKLSNFLG